MDEAFCCVICGNPLANKKKLSARYCDRGCRNRAIDLRRRQETLRRRNENERVLQEFSMWMAGFHLDLLRQAPAEAGGYRLGLWTGQMMYWFPSLLPSQVYRQTLYRTRTQNEFFSLHPFEPPIVPIVAHYKVQFVQNIPPHPDLPESDKAWWLKIPYALPHRRLPFNIKAVPREQR